jgi:hypothetical protein
VTTGALEQAIKQEAAAARKKKKCFISGNQSAPRYSILPSFAIFGQINLIHEKNRILNLDIGHVPYSGSAELQRKGE